MKRIISILILSLLLAGCAGRSDIPQIAASTLPVYDFTMRLCDGTGLSVGRLVNENVSCLHDYSLSVRQMRVAEQAEVIVLNGAGLEDFMDDVLSCRDCIVDCSEGIDLLPGEEEFDPHIWLSPELAAQMAENICKGLSEIYPQYAEQFAENLQTLNTELEQLAQYGKSTLSDLSCRKIITFHDGFSYFSECFDLEILEAVEEEAGSEASASQLKELCNLVNELHPGVFTETNGSDSAAKIISRETGSDIYTLDMAMSGDSYFEAMYRNIDTIKEALD